ncbi:MAG: bis(5'-nucleosyl)-tetraphosphatase [Patescibacteria group bacterium]
MGVERSAGAVIFRDHLFLLLHYESGHWDFPKGGIERGESTEQTIRREVQEETGITDLNFAPGFKETISYAFTQEGVFVRKWVVYLLGETSQPEVRLSSEHQGYAWLTFEEALERITFKNSRQVLRRAHEYLRLKGHAI